MELRAGGVVFSWDDEKAIINVRKHAVTFEEAATVFADPLARVYDDPDHSDSEERSLLVGTSFAGTLLIVANAEEGDKIRIISARPATRRERNRYEEDA